ncbi:hypothetical protein [Roseimicrobium sp. ORNL1]|uniref:DUF7832 domain-containing protein n=1 Tax=Roseimicrobium sp. ORNL1 TaxID=2711231 RepID=UPI0013E1E69F|nr:hypothetical protein [Roseimicrobium sp. ORNL1]QIF01767.1 hypothetical protein G5S37_09595 [Roseimicrobium sp. ORNL1]
MAKSTKYDDADWHYDKKFVESGLPEQHSAHHILYFQRWLQEHDALTDDFWVEVVDDGPRVFPEDFRPWGDIVFLDYMVKPEWRPFVEAYYESEYARDYVATLKGELPSMYHIPFTDEGSAKLKPVLDERYAQWQEKPDRWLKPQRQTVAQKHPRTIGTLATVGFILLLVLVVVVVGKLFDLVERAIQGTVFQVPVTILVFALMGWGVWTAFRKKA